MEVEAAETLEMIRIYAEEAETERIKAKEKAFKAR